jgi:hypothetical protein
MNVRLQYDLEFVAGIYYDNQLQLNTYSVVINLLTKTKDPVSINIAMERLKWFVHGELANTVFFGPHSMDQAELFYSIGVNVTTLPEEPVDQIVGMMLFNKLNAIMEDRMVVSSLDISSTLGDGVWYLHDDEDSQGPFAHPDGWWNLPSLQHETVELEDIPNNVVKVITDGWRELELDWPEETTITTGNTVVFANFAKHEN